MPKINILDSSIYNLIAAGEVVERPASVIKELVENSLDAGAYRVTIDVRNGGIDFVRVTDDGCGIGAEDLHKVFLPHSTSKISSAEDLNHIITLGFRGEALASISAVSSCVIASRTPESELGFSIGCDNGVLGEVVPVGMPLGTAVTVEGLFEKIPARAKFLKKGAQEEGAVSNLVLRILLSRPDVAFKYIADGETKYQTHGKGMIDALISLYGKDMLEKLFYVQKTGDNITIEGYVSKPTHHKPNRTHQTLMVNGRYVINSSLSMAVQKACDDGLMKRQYPMFVLDLKIAHDKVDINVHPNKLDVRFLDASGVFSFVFSAVKTALTKDLRQDYLTKKIEQFHSQAEAVSNTADSIPSDNGPIAGNEIGSVATGSSKVNNEGMQKSPAVDFGAWYNLSRRDAQNDSWNAIGTQASEVRDDGGKMYAIMKRLSQMTQDSTMESVGTEGYVANSHSAAPVTESTLLDEVEKPKYKYVGTMFDTFLIVQRDGEVLFFDQHAAHERLIYDRLMSVSMLDDVGIQDLLVPYVFDVNHIERDALAELIPALTELGFGVEPFGGMSYRVSHVPAALSDINLGSFVNTILSEVSALGKITAQELLKERLAMSACKAAVKAGDKLTESEVQSLLAQFDANQTIPLCPHGRPVLIKYSKSDIEKWFKRIV